MRLKFITELNKVYDTMVLFYVWMRKRKRSNIWEMGQIEKEFSFFESDSSPSIGRVYESRGLVGGFRRVLKDYSTNDFECRQTRYNENGSKEMFASMHFSLPRPFSRTSGTHKHVSTGLSPCK